MEPTPRDLEVEFRLYGLRECPPHQKSEVTTTLTNEFARLNPEERRRIYKHIKRVISLSEDADRLESEVAALQLPGLSNEKAISAKCEGFTKGVSAWIASLEDLDRAWKPHAETDSLFQGVVQADLVTAQIRLGEAYSALARVPAKSPLRKLDAQREHKIGRDWDQAYQNLFIETRNAWAARQKPCPIPSIEAQNPGPEWQMQGHLQGGMGTITVLARDDGNGKIGDRVVMKDTQMSEKGWNDPCRFYGEVSREAFDRKVPVEFWAHRQAWTGQHEHVVGLLSEKPMINEENKIYRLILDFAPLGDLHDFIDRYYAADLAIPEPFILYTFKALVEACLILKKGVPDASVKGPPKWEEIVHRDLKPANLFLGEPNKDCFPGYPEPKLGDFGLSILTSAKDSANPMIWQDAGTQGYWPPEQLSFMDEHTKAPVDAFKMLSPSNVFGIGAILKCMLERRNLYGDEQPKYVANEQYKYYLNSERVKTYNGELISMVEACMNFLPEERPTLEELQEWIEWHISEDEWLTQALDGKQNDTEYTLIQHPQKYQVGMALANPAIDSIQQGLAAL